MNPIIPFSPHFDQSILSKLIDADPVVQRYRQLFALFDWSVVDPVATTGPGRPAHPLSAYVKALLVPTLRHRLVMSYRAESDGVSEEDLLSQL